MRRVSRYFVLAAGVAIVAAGVALFRGAAESPLFSTAPLQKPLALRPGESGHASFSIEKTEIYDVNVEFPAPPHFTSKIPRACPCPPCGSLNLEDATDLIEGTWVLSTAGKPLASGRSKRGTWFRAGDTSGKTLGQFRAAPGRYRIDVTLVSVPADLQSFPGNLSVLLNQNSMTDLGYTIALLPYVRYVAVALVLLGAAVVLVSWFASFRKSAA
jgi:hypothetical protein